MAVGWNAPLVEPVHHINWPSIFPWPSPTHFCTLRLLECSHHFVLFQVLPAMMRRQRSPDTGLGSSASPAPHSPHRGTTQAPRAFWMLTPTTTVWRAYNMSSSETHHQRALHKSHTAYRIVSAFHKASPSWINSYRTIITTIGGISTPVSWTYKLVLCWITIANYRTVDIYWNKVISIPEALTLRQDICYRKFPPARDKGRTFVALTQRVSPSRRSHTLWKDIKHR